MDDGYIISMNKFHCDTDDSDKLESVFPVEAKILPAQWLQFTSNFGFKFVVVLIAPLCVNGLLSLYPHFLS